MLTQLSLLTPSPDVLAGCCDDLLSTSLRDMAIHELHARTAIYTAEPVVDELLDALDWPRGERRLLDPSCGDGAFLCRALLRLLDARPDVDDDCLPDLLQGWELHPSAANQARENIAQVLIQYGRGSADAAAIAGRMVRNQDFLTEGPTSAYCHAIAGNPPYLRWLNIPSILREEYQAVLPNYACADILHSFLDRCSQVLHPDGAIALVTADRWLFNANASKLRAALGQRLGIEQLRRLDCDTAFYRPKDRRQGSAPRIHPVAVVMRPPAQAAIRLDAAPVYPDQLNATTGTGRVLADVASVSLAPWLGAFGVFVVDEATARTLPASHLVPAIDTDDIRYGQLQTPTRYALRTTPDEEPPPAILAHLDRNLHKITTKRRRSVRWLPPETWHTRPLDAEILLVPRIAKTLRPVRVGPNTLPINHNLSIVASGEMSLDQLEDLLNSAEANEWMRSRAARLENGYLSLTTSILRQMPVFYFG